MVDEYIKRKDVLECIKESRDGIDWGQSEDGDAFLHYSACLYRTIASNECFPSADVAEVKHEKWEYIESFIDPLREINQDRCRCSNCGYIQNFGNRNIYLFSYCPECGARMDGGT